MASTFNLAEDARVQRKGQLKARFKVELSADMWCELQNFLKASLSLSGLELTLLERVDEGNCIEVVMPAAARQRYAFNNPEVTPTGKDITCAAGAKSFKAPEASPMSVRAVATPCKNNLASLKRCVAASSTTAADDLHEKPAKRSRTQEPKTSTGSPTLCDVSARLVPAGVEGVVAAKAGLAGALQTKDLHAAVAWLKGLGRRQLNTQELEQTRSSRFLVHFWGALLEPK